MWSVMWRGSKPRPAFPALPPHPIGPPSLASLLLPTGGRCNPDPGNTPCDDIPTPDATPCALVRAAVVLSLTHMLLLSRHQIHRWLLSQPFAILCDPHPIRRPRRTASAAACTCSAAATAAPPAVPARWRAARACRR